MSVHPILWEDLMSQPCRAIEVLCRMNGLDIERRGVRVGKGEHMKPEYKAINPLGKVPYMTDGPTHIGDSIAILIYLCQKYKLPEHWYPADPRSQARVNTVLGWHGSTLRTGSTVTIFNRALAPLRGRPGDEYIVENFGLPRLTDALRVINDVWLANSNYVAGDDVSIADLILATEIDMSLLLDAATRPPSHDEMLEPYSRVREWLARLRQRCSPHYEATNEMLKRARASAIRILRDEKKSNL